MTRLSSVPWIALAMVLCALPAWGQIPHNQDEAPGPALSPEEAMAQMTLPEGFSVKCFASEPDIVNPVAMTFDRRGRLWLTESLEYPRLDAGTGKDRVKILEDTDHDGRADKVTIFAEGLNIPSGIAIGYGGVFVANAPDLLFLCDTDGDDVADTREVLFSGFGRDDVHELPSALTWGPDGWLYGLNGVFNRTKIEHQGRTFEFTCALWRYHPRTRVFEVFCEGTSNPWGLDYDGEGSFFVSACVIDHLWHLTETGYYHRQAGAYPPHTWKLGSIVSHKHQKAAYCGLCWYDAPAYPEAFRRKLYMGNIHGSCINSDRLERHGSTYRAFPEMDFVSAHDAWFMPVSQKVGPDGCLWLLDWYDRYHCYQDARRDPEGIDRGFGRIYRVTYGDQKGSPAVDIDQLDDHALVKMLANENVFLRRQARQVLVERDRAAESLESVALDQTKDETVRREALWTRISQPSVEAPFLEKLLADPDPVVRAWGVRRSGELTTGNETLTNAIMSLSNDDDPRVRLEVAIAARKRLAPPDAAAKLLEIAQNASVDPSGLLEQIAWRNLEKTLPESLPRVAAWLSDSASGSLASLSPEVRERLMRRLLDLPEGEEERVGQLFIAMLRPTGESSPATQDTILSTLFEAARTTAKQRLLVVHIASAAHSQLTDQENQSSSNPIARLGVALLSGDSASLAKAVKLLSQDSVNDEQRLQLFEAWTLSPNRQASDLTSLFPSMVERLAPQALPGLWRIASRLDSPVIAEVVIASYPALPESARPQAIDLLVARPGWADSLLSAIESGKIPKQDVGINPLRQLARTKDGQRRARVEKIWGRVRREDRRERLQVVSRMRQQLDALPGNIESGATVFNRVCAQCHKVGNTGHDVGPELTRNGTASLDNLVSNVFDPNLVVGDDYQQRLILTDDGRSLAGLVVEESGEQVVLKIAGGERLTIARDEIDEMRESDLSLMPEGLEKQISEQEFSDLVAFLRAQSVSTP